MLVQFAVQIQKFGKRLCSADVHSNQNVKKKKTPSYLQTNKVVLPGPLRISRTLPCFKVLAGLKGPSNSSLLTLAVFTVKHNKTLRHCSSLSLKTTEHSTSHLHVTIAGASFPFDMEVAVFIVGALKVNPDCRIGEPKSIGLGFFPQEYINI